MVSTNQCNISVGYEFAVSYYFWFMNLKDRCIRYTVSLNHVFRAYGYVSFVQLTDRKN